MKRNFSDSRLLLLAAVAALTFCACAKQPGIAPETQADLLQRATASLESLYAVTPEAQNLKSRSVAIVVFPDIFKAGLIVGGSGGNGVIFSPDGNVLGYCNTASVSFGLQAGAQEYAQALFITTQQAVNAINSRSGWAIGVGPSVVVVEQGMAKDLSTTTALHDVYAFIYGQKGLMGGIGLQGQKITRLR